MDFRGVIVVGFIRDIYILYYNNMRSRLISDLGNSYNFHIRARCRKKPIFKWNPPFIAHKRVAFRPQWGRTESRNLRKQKIQPE